MDLISVALAVQKAQQGGSGDGDFHPWTIPNIVLTTPFAVPELAAGEVELNDFDCEQLNTYGFPSCVVITFSNITNIDGYTHSILFNGTRITENGESSFNLLQAGLGGLVISINKDFDPSTGKRKWIVSMSTGLE